MNQFSQQTNNAEAIEAFQIVENAKQKFEEFQQLKQAQGFTWAAFGFELGARSFSLVKNDRNAVCFSFAELILFKEFCDDNDYAFDVETKSEWLNGGPQIVSRVVFEVL